MYCSKCGSLLEDDAIFCEKCGNRVVAEKKTFAFEKNKVSKIFQLKYIISVLVVLVAVIGGIIYYQKQPKKIYLNDFVTVDFSGYDSLGTATWEFDSDAFCDKYGDVIKIKELQDIPEEYRDEDNLRIINRLYKNKPAELLVLALGGELDVHSALSNGDTVTFQWNCEDDGVNAFFDVKLVYSDITFTVSGLEEIKVVDPFEDIEITYVDAVPRMSVEATYTGNNEKLKETHYWVKQSNNLQKGDKFTVVADVYASNDELAKTYGFVLSSTEKEFTVDKENRYLKSISEIDQNALDEMYVHVEDIIYNKINTKINIKKLTHENNIFMYNENEDVWDDMNRVCFIYHVDAEIINSDTLNPISYYYYVILKNIYISEDGTYTVDYENCELTYETFCKEFEGDWSYERIEGYESLGDLFISVSENNSQYAIESNMEAPAVEIDMAALDKEQEKMLCALDAMNCALINGDYNDKDADFYWTVMYYLGVNFPYEYNVVNYQDDGKLFITNDWIQEFSNTLFPKVNRMPELNSYNIEKATDADGYFFSDSDRGWEHSEIASWKGNEDGTYTVVSNLIEDDYDEPSNSHIMASYSYTLDDNDGKFFKYKIINVNKN